jgi:hypothetical protein
LEKKYGFNKVVQEWIEFKKDLYEKFEKKELILPQNKEKPT